MELVSEVYSFVNKIISAHSNPEDYWFRLWVRIEVNEKSGEILGHPNFDIDIFKYIGKIGGKYSEINEDVPKLILVETPHYRYLQLLKMG